MMKYSLLLPVFLLIFWSCGAGKGARQSKDTATPEWIGKTPADPQYYHGIGSAPKTDRMDYREKARQNALADIAGNISVTISGTSVLLQVESDNRFSDYYRESIQSTTRNFLEGYELADSWETRERYWVYFRLSKAEYERLRKARIDEALSASEAKYHQAVAAKNQGKTEEALSGLVLALEDIRDFLGEELHSHTSGQAANFAGMLYAEFTTLVRSVRISFTEPQLAYSFAKQGETTHVDAFVSSETIGRLVNIPVIVGYSCFPGRKDQLISDAGGVIRIRPGTFPANLRTEQITVITDVQRLVSETTRDPVIRRLLGSVKAPEYILPVSITPPVFHLEISGNPATGPYHEMIIRELTSKLSVDGYPVTRERDKGDFTLSIILSPGQNQNSRNKTTVALTAEISLTNITGTALYRKQAGPFNGLGSSGGEALHDACTALTSHLKITTLPSIYRNLQTEH